MVTYLSIDGDDIGNKIARCYIENNETGLVKIIQELSSILTEICEYLKRAGFEVVFCAADGIVCKGPMLDLDTFGGYIRTVGQPNFTFSVGAGSSLQASFFALKYAKSIGKNIIVISSEEEKFKVIEIAT